jgi:DNA (cytosine-5)-methyltransferase 1
MSKDRGAVYYNENDLFAVAWLRELIKAGLLPEGEVDERSILDVGAAELRPFRQCHFFAGVGGWSHALALAGWPEDREVWTGSCPCQPLSVAGQRRGHADERHLWPAFHRLIAERRPAVVFGEQVAGRDGLEWFAGVRADLEASGYACGAAVMPASAVGAPHRRERLWWGASMEYAVRGRHGPADEAICAGRERIEFRGNDGRGGGFERSYGPGFWSDAQWLAGADGKTRRVKPGVCLLADGVPNRVGRLRGYGNAIVPQIAAEFICAWLTGI